MPIEGSVLQQGSRPWVRDKGHVEAAIGAGIISNSIPSWSLVKYAINNPPPKKKKKPTLVTQAPI